VTTLTEQLPAFGGLLRTWRRTRRVSQLELSSVSGVSSRHLSFIETGRATPSRTMVLRLAQELDVPLRERNALLQAAGYAPEYGETPLDAPEMAVVWAAIDTVLQGHLPYPALALDSCWNLVRGNSAVSLFTDGLPAHLTGPGANTMRITLHPEGLAPHLLDRELVRSRMLRRIRRQAAATGDPRLTALADECSAYPHPDGEPAELPGDPDIVMPFRLRRDGQVLNLFSAIATFGTATDLTVAELSIETFFPADPATAAYMAR
jgi:transcriptional regulator with XRE-family HTH domain